jgi:hypothetical protein
VCLIFGVEFYGLLMWPGWAIDGRWGMRLVLDFGKMFGLETLALLFILGTLLHS